MEDAANSPTKPECTGIKTLDPGSLRFQHKKKLNVSMIMSALTITLPEKKQNKTKHHRHLLVSFVKWKWFWNLLLSSLQYSFKRPSHQKTHLHFWVKWKLLFNGSHKFQHYISTRKKCIYLSIGPVTVNKKSYLTKQDGIFNKYQCMQYCSCWKMISLLPQSSKK